MSNTSNDANTQRPTSRPEIGTTLVKRTDFGDKLVAAFLNQDTRRLAR